MKDYKKITNILIIMIILNMVAIGVYGYVFYDMKKMTESSIEKRKEVKINLAKKARLNEIEKTISTINDQADILKNIILNEDKLIDFLRIIEELADLQNLSVENQIQRQDTNAKGEFSNLSFTLKTKGSWQNSQNFLALIENLPYKINVKKYSARLSGGTADTEESVVGSEIIWDSEINFEVLTRVEK